MDFEEKYKKAVEKLDKLLNHDTVKESGKVFADVVRGIFPELQESEDERIRKALISFLKSPFVNENITDEKVTLWIAWLEKQEGAKKFPWSDDYEKKWLVAYLNNREINTSIMQEKKAIKNAIAWIEKQDSVKSEWSESDEETIKFLRRILGEHGYAHSMIDVNGDFCDREYVEADRWLKSIKNRIFTQWENTDDMVVDLIIQSLELLIEEHRNTIADEEFGREIDWLKALKNRVVPRPRKEWNEKDENAVNKLVAVCSGAKNYAQFAGCKQEELTKLQDWLFSLKNRTISEPEKEWTKEDERLRNFCIHKIEEELEELRKDNVGHSEIISDLKEECWERIKWLESLDRTNYKRTDTEWTKEDKKIVDTIKKVLHSSNVGCMYTLNNNDYEKCVEWLDNQNPDFQGAE